MNIKVSDEVKLINDDYIQIWERREDGEDKLWWEGYTSEQDEAPLPLALLKKKVKGIRNESYFTYNECDTQNIDAHIQRIIEIRV